MRGWDQPKVAIAAASHTIRRSDCGHFVVFPRCTLSASSMTLPTSKRHFGGFEAKCNLEGREHRTFDQGREMGQWVARLRSRNPEYADCAAITFV